MKKIGVIGPGIVGMPMAALLAKSFIDLREQGEVIVIQRNSKFSGWKVDAINSGKSTIGGIEPQLDDIVSEAVSKGILKSSFDYSLLKNADAVLVCVQTDKKDLEPDYIPLFDALNNLALALKEKHSEKKPLIVIESTLAPSSMISLIKPFFSCYDLEDGRDIYLCNSPNRVMPGRLIERVTSSDKIVGGLNKETLKLLTILYSRIVKGNILQTNSMTAEIVKTLENAYRDVRIAFSAEVARYCDMNDIDFYLIREEVNKLLSQADYASVNPNVVPSGGILIPTIGVGGHCLPKDGILLLWRKLKKGNNTTHSLILKARQINDASPSESIKLVEKKFGSINGTNIALLGAAYRFNSEDTRNSPTLPLAQLLLEKNCKIKIHDPYVKHADQNLIKYNLTPFFTNDLEHALHSVDFIFFCTAHHFYLNEFLVVKRLPATLKGIFDGCNLFSTSTFKNFNILYTGIGRGNNSPSKKLIEYIYKGFQIVEKGFANETGELIKFLNENFIYDEFNNIDFKEVQKLASTCITGCNIVDPGPLDETEPFNCFSSTLINIAQEAQKNFYNLI